MLTEPKPRSRNRRSAAATIASRDPPRRALGWLRRTLCELPCKIPLALISAYNILHRAVQCKASSRARPCSSGSLAAEPHAHHFERQRQCSSSRIAVAALIAATLAGCDKPAPPTPEPRPVRTVTVERRAAGETVSLTGQVRAKDQVEPRLPPRRAHDRAARQCRRCGQGRPGRRPARPPESSRTRCARRKPTSRRPRRALTQARLTFGAAAGAPEEWLDDRAPNSTMPSRRCGRPQAQVDSAAGAAAHRAGSAELHGPGRRRPGRGDRGRRRTGRGGAVPGR